jgi:multiple sugar transport system permease protein
MLKSTRAQENLFGWLFVMPAVLGFVAFVLVPGIAAVGLAFTKYRFISPPEFIGLANFVKIFTADKVFLKALTNSGIFWLFYVPIHLVVALFLAVILNEPLRGSKLFRSLYFVPYITPMVAISYIWLVVFDVNWGFLNYYLMRLGMPRIDWLGQAWPARAMVAFVQGWKTVGFPTLIFLAALQDVPQEIYESAQLDGATAWRRLLSITVPLISPSIFYMFVISTIASFQTFDVVYLMTQGGPGRATHLYAYNIYQMGFRSFRLGYGTALALVLFFILAIVTWINFRLQKRWVHYG